jgi:hypothetical protein
MTKTSFHSIFIIIIIIIIWDSTASTDANKLKRTQQKFATLCINRFFPKFGYSSALPLEQIKIAHFA